MARPTMLVYSSRRWKSVAGRMHHVLSRLAESRRILYVEPPLGNADAETWERVEQRKNFSVHRPRLRGDVDGFAPATHERLAGLLESLAGPEGIGRHTAWIATPLAYPPAWVLAPEVIAYDCTDESAHELSAHSAVAEIEGRLLRQADVVITPGPTLYAAKKDRHPNVHCIPDSVDAGHFRRGRPGHAAAADYADMPRPRLGFYGVIDGRVDLALIAGVAFAHPEWQLVLVGPLRNIEPADVPQAPNLHWLGERPYDELPSHLAAWDVCLLPYAVNENTRYLSPTMTLEYMAAEHPIVSTPIRDVVGPYEDIVHVGEFADGFARACGYALAESGIARSSRIERMRSIVDHTSWNHVAKRIEQQLGHLESRFAHYDDTLELMLGSLLRTRDA